MTCKMRCDARGVLFNSDYDEESGEGTLRTCEAMQVLAQVSSQAQEPLDDAGDTTVDASEDTDESTALETLNCTSGSPQDALDVCMDGMANGTAEDVLEACAIDVCIGGEELLNRTIAVATQSQQLVAEELRRAEASKREPVEEPVLRCHTCISGESCFNDVKWAMEIGIPQSHYNATWAPAALLDNSSCFERAQSALKAFQSMPGSVTSGMQDPNIPEPCAGASEPDTTADLVYCSDSDHPGVPDCECY